jgi:hypothetical protein
MNGIDYLFEHFYSSCDDSAWIMVDDMMLPVDFAYS